MTSTFDNLGKDPLLTESEELELARLIQAGRQPDATKSQKHKAYRAKQRMILGNIRLAVTVAAKYRSVCKHMFFDDLVQEAIFGLNRAAEKFDPQRGYKFSTYAYYWIRQSIKRAIAEFDSEIRIPVHVTDEIYRYNKVARETGLLKKEEIAAKANASLLNLELAARAKGICSLNKVLEDNEFINSVASEPDASDYAKELGIDLDDLASALEKLPADESMILKLSYGLFGFQQINYTLIGEKFGISRESIRKTKLNAFQKLKKEIKVQTF